MSQDKLLDLVSKKSLVEVVIGMWLGREVADNEAKLLEEMMALVIDHGPDSPSAQATITATQSGQDLLRSVEAGVSQINQSHGGAIEGCARIIQTEKFDAKEIVGQALVTGDRLPGFGHRLYKDEDPRSVYLLDRAQSLGVAGLYVQRVQELEKELEQQKGKRLVINIDGAMAAVLSELKVKPESCNAFFLWPRVAGLVYRWRLVRNENR